MDVLRRAVTQMDVWTLHHAHFAASFVKTRKITPANERRGRALANVWRTVRSPIPDAHVVRPSPRVATQRADATCSLPTCNRGRLGSRLQGVRNGELADASDTQLDREQLGSPELADSTELAAEATAACAERGATAGGSSRIMRRIYWPAFRLRDVC